MSELWNIAKTALRLKLGISNPCNEIIYFR